MNALKENIRGIFNKIILPAPNGKVVIDVNNIIRCEAQINYTIFHLMNKDKITTSKTLKEYQELLGEYSFFCIQKSHLVNLIHVKRYYSGRGGQLEMKDGTLLQVSRDQKKLLLEKLSTFS